MSRRRVASAAFVLVAQVGALAACGGDAATGADQDTDCQPPANTPTTVVVTMRNFGFHPQTVGVQPGTTVTWVNCEPAGRDAHTTTSRTTTWESPFLKPGDAFSHTFDQAGRFEYYCVPHPAMQGVVIVE